MNCCEWVLQLTLSLYHDQKAQLCEINIIEKTVLLK